VFYAYFYASESVVMNITPQDAYKALSEGALLIDIREEFEVRQLAFKANNIRYLPMQEIPHRLEEIPHDRTVIFACAHATRSDTACQFVMQYGYSNVFSLTGGLAAWFRKGLPVDR
jgi:rhodanese-related sulfurtransferase